MVRVSSLRYFRRGKKYLEKKRIRSVEIFGVGSLLTKVSSVYCWEYSLYTPFLLMFPDRRYVTGTRPDLISSINKSTVRLQDVPRDLITGIYNGLQFIVLGETNRSDLYRRIYNSNHVVVKTFVTTRPSYSIFLGALGTGEVYLQGKVRGREKYKFQLGFKFLNLVLFSLV